MVRGRTPADLPIEDLYESFELLYPTRRRDRDRLNDLIAGPTPLNPAPLAILDYMLTPASGTKSPLCKAVVVETRYRDRDHTRAVAAYYQRSFRPINHECMRLHFFSRRLSSDDLGSLDQFADYYLGFCVLRPFPFRKIGRTILKNVKSNTATEFPICEGRFQANIGGSQIEFYGTPFMEQDTVVAACASTSIWMSLATLDQRYLLQQRTSSEITEIANQFLLTNRAMPSDGLVPEQMIQALSHMEYDPLLLIMSSPTDSKHLIYSYVESKIPVILLMQLASGGNHTIVAVAHGYEAPINNPATIEVRWPGEAPLRFSRSSEWIPNFLVNDDQRGPFRTLRFLQPDPVAIRTQLETGTNLLTPDQVDALQVEDWNCPVEIDMDMPTIGLNGGEELGNLWGALVPLPPGVTLTSEQAERKAAHLIRFWHDLTSINLPDGLVLRTYLIASNDYKKRLEQTNMDDFVKLLYKGKPMPRWIWVTEISSVGTYNNVARDHLLIFGEVIVDATSNQWTGDFLAFHYIERSSRGIVVTMLPEHQDAEEALVKYWYSDNRIPYIGVAN